MLKKNLGISPDPLSGIVVIHYLLKKMISKRCGILNGDRHVMTRWKYLSPTRIWKKKIPLFGIPRSNDWIFLKIRRFAHTHPIFVGIRSIAVCWTEGVNYSLYFYLFCRRQRLKLKTKLFFEKNHRYKKKYSDILL